MKARCKVVIAIIIGLILLILGARPVEAKQLSTPLYFGINEIRMLSTPHWGYAIGDPNTNGSEGKAAKIWNILKYSSSTSNDPTEVDVYCVKAGVGFHDTHRRATYNLAFDMYKERDEIAARSSTLSALVNGGHYDELLALANILYLPETEDEAELTAYLERAGIRQEYWDSLITVDEVKAVQQAAIWYFTNYGEEDGKYDKTASDATGWLNYTEDGINYTSLGDYQTQPNRLGYQRQMQAEQLYRYLINTAKANSANYSDPNKNYKTKLTLYTAQGTSGEEQPLMEIEREKEFDLSLRKYITKVNGANVSISREPQVDVSALNDLTDTTATYKHKKDPVLVENGDVVTYKIQVYNEGDVDGYVNKIVDQLPTGLRFSRLITSGYTANYDSANNTVTITRNSTNNDRLTAFSGTTLDSTTLELECIVDTTVGDKVLTNVAWISEEETIDGKVITNEVGDDRDSEPSTKPSVNKDSMENYKGNSSNKSDLTDKDYFYKGEQDDDDFEKLITKKIEGSYDLQIVKVDKENNEKLQGASFKVTMPDGSEVTKTTNVNGVIDLDEINITEEGTDTIKIEEVTPPSGYNKLFNSFEIEVTKEQENGEYVATNVSLKNAQGSGLGQGEIQVNNQNGLITVTVPNIKKTGSYDLQLVKIDKDTNEKLQGASFKITMPDGSEVTKTTDGNGVIDLDAVTITEVGTDTIKVEELNAPDGYNKLFNSFEVQVTKGEQSGAYVVTNVSLKNTQGSGLGQGDIKVNYQNGLITMTVPNIKKTGNYDLQLIKIDKENNARLQGASFKVTMPDGSEVTKTTDENGAIDLDAVEITEEGIDTIKIEELNAPDGYNKLFNSFEVEITKEEQNGEYVVTDVSLKNTQGSGLGQGQVQVNYNNGLVTITVPNEKIEGNYSIQLEKVDSEDSSKKLQGAEFNITLPNNEKQTKTTNEDGIIDFGVVQINDINTKDTITVEETKAPEGYNKILGSMTIEIEKELLNGSYKLKNATITSGQVDGTTVSIEGDTVKIIVSNEKVKEFDLSLRKFIIAVSNDENIEDGEYLKNSDGSYKREPIVDTSLLNTTEADGTKVTTAIYNHTKEPVKVRRNDYVVYMLRVYNEGEIDGYASEIKDHLPPYLEFVDNEFNEQYGWEVSEDGRTVTTRYLENSLVEAAEEIENGYNLSYVEVQIMCKVKQTAIAGENITNIADITEYQDENKEPANDRDSEKDNVELPEDEDLPNYKDEEKGDYVPGQEDDDDFEKIKIEEFDLSLRKFIVAVSNDENIEDEEILKNGDGSYKREPVVDTSLLNTIDSNGNIITTAIYNHTKEPIAVKRNDYVVYMLRVYNEGDIDGYASEIKDHLPPYLEFVDNEFNAQYGWQVSEDGRTVTTRYLEDSLINAAEQNGEGTYVLSYVEVPIMCRITDNAPTSENITNIADITEYQDENKQPANDRDSEEDNVELPNDEELPNYKDEEKGEYVPGQEDDDDFEKIKIEEFDLSLRKFIVAVSNDENIEDEEILKNADGSYIREPVVDTSLLNKIDSNGNIITTAIYNHTKEPVRVKRNDYVVYMLRVYNEGDIDGYASEIKDHLPPYLEFVDNEFNKQYGWEVLEDGRTVITRYLENNLIEAAEIVGNSYELSYVEIPIMCKVIDSAVNNEDITNIADITEYQDENREPEEDRDSEEDNVELPSDEELPNYKDEEEGDYIPGQEDDDDFEKVVVQEFDLALRKFITKVDDEDVTTRIPEVNYDEETGKITYEHTKEPVEVVTDNIVTYTIRIFNEGDINGYANVISDDIPEGLEFIPDDETNINYRWVMYDAEGNITDDVSQAETIRTDYLSKEQEENPGENLLHAFNPNEPISETNPEYKDVQVAFKVIEPNGSDRIIVNSAQISDDSDEDGNEVDDKDSVPDEWNDGEDDQDKEYIKLVYFDLSLRKWVTQAIVIDENGQKITETGHQPYDDPEQIVKVDLHRKHINDVIVKFRYKIRVTNEGEIAGYAKEITDYVPEGLRFLPEDNPGWTDEGNNIISTRLLENTLLQPGEYAEVEVVLTWINNEDNMGLKENIAEISEDYNDYGVPDRDSTPDNQQEGEDDIDDAPVMLSVSTGQIRIYFTLGFVVLITIASGIVLIKKFVL